MRFYWCHAMSIGGWSEDSPAPIISTHATLWESIQYSHHSILQYNGRACLVRTMLHIGIRENIQIINDINSLKHIRSPIFYTDDVLWSSEVTEKAGERFPSTSFLVETWLSTDPWERYYESAVPSSNAERSILEHSTTWRSGAWLTTLCFCASPTKVTSDF